VRLPVGPCSALTFFQSHQGAGGYFDVKAGQCIPVSPNAERREPGLICPERQLRRFEEPQRPYSNRRCFWRMQRASHRIAIDDLNTWASDSGLVPGDRRGNGQGDSYLVRSVSRMSGTLRPRSVLDHASPRFSRPSSGAPASLSVHDSTDGFCFSDVDFDCSAQVVKTESELN
jgi:hypothetical protein